MHNFHAGLNHFLFVSIILFALGVYGIVTRKTPAMILVGIELILSSVLINFIAFQKFTRVSSEGQVFSLFIIIFAVLQSVIAGCIIINFYRNNKMKNVEISNHLNNDNT